MKRFRLGIRGKLFLVSVALVAAVVLASGAFLHIELRDWLEARIESELRHTLAEARAALQSAAISSSPDAVDRLADELGHGSGTRVTVTDSSGAVIGDSEVPAEELAAVENHGQRPEVRGALLEGFGKTRRYSTTIGVHLLYLAMPYRTHSGATGVIRVALPLHEVESLLARVRRMVLIAGAIGLSVALGMTWLISRLLTRTVRELVESAGAIAAGGTGARVPVRSNDELGGLSGSLNRLAERLDRTVASLASERNRLEAVLEGMSEAVLALSAEGRVTLMNRAALDLLDLDGPPTSKTLLEVLRVPALDDVVRAARTRGEPGTVEFELTGDRHRVLLARVTPQRAGGGCVVVLHDITEIRRLEKVRRDFVANVSHELRTPVAAISANAETLASGALEDPLRAHEFLDALVRSATRLGRIIDDLLDLSKIEAGAYPLDAQAVVADEAALRAIALLVETSRAKNLDLRWVATDARPVVAWADERALEEVLGNLLDNAVKYTPSGGHVTVCARPSAEAVRFEVTDDGPGVPSHQRSRVFERFYRVDAGRSREMGGTGLGLAIVKHLVEAMGGKVGLEAVEPSGCRFWFTVPAAKRSA